jgi:hypothetical protein
MLRFHNKKSAQLLIYHPTPAQATKSYTIKAVPTKPPQLAGADIPTPSLGTKPPTEIQSSVKPEREIKPVVGFSSSPNIGNITNVLTGRQQFPQAGTPSISSKEFWNQSQTEVSKK